MSIMHKGQRDLLNLVERNNCDALTLFLAESEHVAELLNPAHGKPPLAHAKSVAVAQALISRGAAVDAVAKWWAPGFGILSVDTTVGRFLVEQGASLTPHAAAGLGRVDVLREMLAADRNLPAAKGGDETTPLHFARDVDTARFLIESGAELDARDADHNSTPVQWLIGACPEVVRYLIEQGATPDIFLAAALGDRGLVDKLIAADRRCLALRVGTAADDPPPHYENLGSTIYQWTLGFNCYAHQYAAARGHLQLFDHLFAESSTTTQFLVACVMARRDPALRIAKENPGLVASLPSADLELLARYCWETNTDLEAVRLMLDLGFPIDHPETRHSYMPIHNAAWSGSADLVDLLIERGAAVDQRDPSFHSTPLEHAVHCCCVEGRHPEGEYGRVVGALIDAGSPWDPTIYPTQDPGIDSALELRLPQRGDSLATSDTPKARLRTHLQELHQQAEPAARQTAARAIRERVLSLPQLTAARSVFLCLSFGHEVDTWPLIDTFLSQGKHVYVPRTDPGNPHLSVHRYPCELRTLKFGLQQPSDHSTRVPESEVNDVLDVALVLGIGFDNDGYRLGHGAGYFDRFLAQRPFAAIGLAYDFQLLRRIPYEPHDIPMHTVVTESRIVTARKSRDS